MTKHRARKCFGHHFLTDPGVIDAIVHAIGPQPDDVIVEIGPGHGAITSALAASARHLHCVELDRDLARALRNQYCGETNVSVHEADALDFDYCGLGRGLRVVGNLPYNISTPLLFRLLDSRDCITDMHFMLQKEVVDRMTASPGSKAYGAISIFMGAAYEKAGIHAVSRSCFYPVPGVDSQLLYLKRKAEPVLFCPPAREMVRNLFTQRRKQIGSLMQKHPLLTDWLDNLPTFGCSRTDRPEVIPLDAWLELNKRLAVSRD